VALSSSDVYSSAQAAGAKHPGRWNAAKTWMYILLDEHRHIIYANVADDPKTVCKAYLNRHPDVKERTFDIELREFDTREQALAVRLDIWRALATR
jgi:hypothetical protein